MRKLFAPIILALIIAATVSPLAAPKGVAGDWTLSAHGSSMRLVLAQEGTDGKTVTGTLEDPHGGLIPLKGEFMGDTLTVSGSSEGSHGFQLTLTGTIQRDGSLAGSLTSNVGDMSWTAVRTVK